jgi:uncharacterized protein with GYD domain
MGWYITLASWTDQGIKNVKDSPKRLDAARETARKHGCEIKEFYLTIGAWDMVTIVEAPDDEALARYLLATASWGNMRTTTLKAISEESYRTIIAAL